ncbi:MAG: AAA family ATPase [Chloroflexi bacterium]|nr:AAA family ATPase [Chloroflexota bacterium]
MANELALKSFRLKNFKAIRDSGVVKFTPLTVLIGDNGSGKSSFVEGLQTFQRIVLDGLDDTMNLWRGYENIRHGAAPQSTANRADTRVHQEGVIEFSLSHRVPIENETKDSQSHSNVLKVACAPDGDEIFIMEERWNVSGQKYMARDSEGYLYDSNGERLGGGITFPIALPFEFEAEALQPGKSLISSSRATPYIVFSLASWQFVTLNAWTMGEPQPIQRTGGMIHLRSDGSNIAEYLSGIREHDEDAFEGILETLQYVLPYMKDLKPELTDVLGRQSHLEMSEADFKVKGWLLSTGTLRILALLALFRHPEPPPVIVIEEIENGLDPRTIHLIVEELRNLVESGRSQVIVTTHSPYLLDLLPLWSIVLVERSEDKGPVFSRPDDNPALEKWAEKFGPGKLYTMQGLSLGEGG